MKTERNIRPSFPRWWLLTGIPILGILSASAATVTWTGAGTDTNWDTAANWNSGVPADGDELVFPNDASSFDITLDGTASPSRLTFESTDEFNYYVIEGTGTLAGTGVTLVKNGSPKLVLGGNNSFAGEIQVNAGQLVLSNQSLTANTSYALGETDNLIKIAAGASLDLNGQGGAVHATADLRRYYTVQLAGNGIETEPGVFSGAIASTAAGNLGFAGRGKTGLRDLVLTDHASVHVPSGIPLDLGFGSTATNGSITSSGASVRTLTKTGGGSLFLSGTNITTDDITGVELYVKEGDITGFAPSAYGDKVTVGSGASLRTGAAMNVTTPIVLEDGAIVSDFVGAATYSGPFTLLGTPILRATNTPNLIIDSPLNGPADIIVQRTSGSGHIVFTKDSILEGELVISGSIIAYLGNGGATGSFKDSEGNASPVHLGTTGTLAVNLSEDLVFDAPITGIGTLQKLGTNTMRRTAEAEFFRPGGTVASVNAGTLLINNATGYGLDEGAVNVSAEATLGGTGSIAGTVNLGTANPTAARAYLSPGDGPGDIDTFTVGRLVFASSGTGTIELEIAGSSADKLVIEGDALLSPAKIAELALSEIGAGATEASYTLIEYTGAFHGTFSSITGLPDGYRVRHDPDNKRIVLEQSEEPQPLPLVLYWDGGTADIAEDGNGAAAVSDGIWNSTLKNWDQGPAEHTAWINDGSAIAILATGAHTITIDDASPIAVSGLKRFGTTSSVTLVTGGTLHLQPGADLLEARFGDANQGLRIASKLTGTGGFNVLGGASSGANHSRVALQNPAGDNTITGPVSILGGHLRLHASHQLGDSAVVTANTSIPGAVATLETGSGANETIAGLHFGPGGGELKLGGSGVSELTLDGGGLTIANAATFTYGSSASGIRFANGGELAKSGDANVIIARANPANFIDLGGLDRTIRVDDFGSLTIGVNLLNGGVVKQGEGTLVLGSDANAYEGDTTIAEGVLRLAHPTLHDGSTLEIAADALLDLAFATEDTADTVRTLIVAGESKLPGTYGPAGTTLPGVTALAAISGTGLIVVESGGAPADPYGDWADSFGLDPETEEGAPGGDFDNDGLANAIEYVLGSNPASGASANLPSAERQGDNLVFVFTRSQEAAAAGFASGVEWSTTLATWDDAGVDWLSVEDNEDGTETVTATIPVPEGATKIFARLKVTIP